MRNFAELAFAIVFSLAFAGAAAAQEYDVRGWQGWSHRDDATGRFISCTVSARYDNGQSIVFAINANRAFVVALGNREWTLEVGEFYSARLTIDGHDFGVTRFEAYDESEARIVIPYTPDALGRLRKGYVLRLETREANYRYQLTGSGKALDWLRDCFAKGAAAR